ncbi:hypothetical protein BESB_073290 [Besnoitia besnoiti]|uniref:Uncharacterized protein n=1 Tax=Besnoitia besnoiti TaxID=94643 RepID=A0A2A9MEX0_BESBE|nr:uncharacterized protein BESB_073290 [Besnoitia besnoiti]PFH34177.1 hypothetical protein BESB_073290 [Besnoitia besnoiti]
MCEAFASVRALSGYSGETDDTMQLQLPLRCGQAVLALAILHACRDCDGAHDLLRVPSTETPLGVSSSTVLEEDKEIAQNHGLAHKFRRYVKEEHVTNKSAPSDADAEDEGAIYDALPLQIKRRAPSNHSPSLLHLAVPLGTAFFSGAALKSSIVGDSHHAWPSLPGTFSGGPDSGADGCGLLCLMSDTDMTDVPQEHNEQEVTTGGSQGRQSGSTRSTSSSSTGESTGASADSFDYDSPSVSVSPESAAQGLWRFGSVALKSASLATGFLAFALAAAAVGLGVRRSSLERHRHGLIGRGTAAWHSRTCFVFIDIDAARTTGRISGRIVPGSARISVSRLSNRAILRYLEKPHLFDNGLQGILRRSIKRVEAFQIPSQCYAEASLSPVPKRRGNPQPVVTTKSAYFREIVARNNAQKGSVVGMLIHLDRCPGWQSIPRDPSIDGDEALFMKIFSSHPFCAAGWCDGVLKAAGPPHPGVPPRGTVPWIISVDTFGHGIRLLASVGAVENGSRSRLYFLVSAPHIDRIRLFIAIGSGHLAITENIPTVEDSCSAAGAFFSGTELMRYSIIPFADAGQPAPSHPTVSRADVGDSSSPDLSNNSDVHQSTVVRENWWRKWLAALQEAQEPHPSEAEAQLAGIIIEMHLQNIARLPKEVPLRKEDTLFGNSN